jgi:hypothetical protein
MTLSARSVAGAAKKLGNEELWTRFDAVERTLNGYHAVQ